jgi:hypothetical protein
MVMLLLFAMTSSDSRQLALAQSSPQGVVQLCGLDFIRFHSQIFTAT